MNAVALLMPSRSHEVHEGLLHLHVSIAFLLVVWNEDVNDHNSMKDI